MHYYLDGYNCLFCIEGIRANLHAQRTHFLERLRTCVSALNLTVTVVFDSSIQTESTRGHLSPLECIYTNKYETADQCLLAIIQHSRFPSKITLVTSDGPLATQARCQGAQTIQALPFLNWLSERYAKAKRKAHGSPIVKTAPQTAPKVLLGPKKSILPPPKPVPPQKQDLCALFEERYRAACAEEEQSTKPKNTKQYTHQQNARSAHSTKRKKAVPPPPAMPLESDTARWQRLFERPQEPEENF